MTMATIRFGLGRDSSNEVCPDKKSSTRGVKSFVYKSAWSSITYKINKNVNLLILHLSENFNLC